MEFFRRISSVFIFVVILVLATTKISYSQDKHEFIINQLNATWKVGLEALNKGDYYEADKQLKEVNRLRLEGGFESLEEYSLILLSEVERMLSQNEIDKAEFVLKKALLFSPANPEILFKSLSSVMQTGVLPFSEHLFKFIQNFARLPRFLLRALNNMIIPILWAFTFAAYFVCMLYCVYHYKTLCSSLTKYAPEKYHNHFMPFIVLAILVVPIFFGPLFCIAVWTFLIHVSNSKRQLFSQLVGLLMILWVIAFPFSEGMSNFIEHEGVKSIMRVNEGSLSAIDYGRFKTLAEQKREDPVIWFSYGQFLRKSGRLDEAIKAFKHFDELSPDRNETKLQIGLIYYLLGDPKNARKLYEEVVESGVKDPNVYFNYSKILFDELLTDDSQKYFRLALEANKTLINDLKEQEDKIGKQAIAEISLPMKEIINWGLASIDDKNERVTGVYNKLCVFGGKPIIGLLGILVFFGLIFIKPRKKHRFIDARFQEYENPEILEGCFVATPGGGYLVSGETTKAFFCLSLIGFFFLCLIGWPEFFSEGVYFIPHFHVVGAVSFLLVWLTMCYLSYSRIINSIEKWKV